MLYFVKICALLKNDVVDLIYLGGSVCRHFGLLTFQNKVLKRKFSSKGFCVTQQLKKIRQHGFSLFSFGILCVCVCGCTMKENVKFYLNLIKRQAMTTYGGAEKQFHTD